MAASNTESDLRRANFRLCRLCVWPNYSGLGFNLENAPPPPYTIRTVESNSPAAAGGIRIRDLVLGVNNQDVSNADYQTVTQAIKNARDSNGRIELLVIEKRFYEPLKSRRIRFDPTFARSIETPTTMPRDYADFPKNKPRTCNIRLQKNDQSFGFEVVNGPQDIGAFIQDVVPNSPAGKTTLRKSDRILEIDDKFVDNEPSRMILEKLFKAKKNRAVKLYVVDTSTYKYFQENRVPLTSKDFPNSSFARNVVPSTYINVKDSKKNQSIFFF
jgi:C-terminal processing protease CtpA/Prc